ncbi:MAG: tetratricopeptide repeat protein [Actinomycetota bacterium]|nr:tetratricopeptide repeat protein [Actinomycetota bacterium]
MEVAHRAGTAEDVLSAFVGGLFFYMRFAQGRPDELVGTIEGLVESQPGAPVWRVALAGVLVECNRIDDARVHFMWLAEDDCAKVPNDVEYPVTIDGLARMAYRVRPPDTVLHSIYDRLLPFRGFMNWSGVGISGPNDLGLAMAAATLGRHDDADRHFAAALALCERAQARCWLARTHGDWSRVLADRGDTARAREQAEISIVMGEELGMTGPFGIVPRGRALLEAL